MARRQASPDNMKEDSSSFEVEPLNNNNHSVQVSGDCSTTNGTSSSSSSSVPVGHWKDSLWDIFRYGYCHCSALHACCCTSVGAGQVITRLKLTYMGQPAKNLAATAGAFTKLLYIFVAFWITRAFLLIMIALTDPNVDSKEWIDPPTSYYVFVAVDDVLVYAYWAFTAVVLYNLRKYVRSKYVIQESGKCPQGCEDACCSCLCPCLVVGQMMRHTADYDTYEGRCCTETGLPFHAPSIV